MCVCMCAYMHINTYMYAYICIYTHLYICIYTHIHVFLNITYLVHITLLVRVFRTVCTGQVIVHFPGEDHLSRSQPSSAAYSPWSFLSPVRHAHRCHLCSAHIWADCYSGKCLVLTRCSKSFKVLVSVF